MIGEKYNELRRRRLKAREERFRKEGIRIHKRNEAQRKRIRLGVVQRRGFFRQRRLEKWNERWAQRRAEEVIEHIRNAVGTLKETKRILEYVPRLRSRIDELLSGVESSYRSAKFEKVFDLSLELQELIAKAETEASQIIEKQRKGRREEGKYFYAVIPFSEEKSFGNIGTNDKEVYTLPYRDIAAVVMDTSITEYELTEENVKRHEAVLRRMMEEYTVIPVEFGTIISNERILKRLLRNAYNPMQGCLKLVDNMVELGVKAILRKDVTPFDIDGGKLSSHKILESLKKKAEQSVSEELFSDRLILNESFLVKKERVDAFSEEVARLEESYPWIKFLYSGPWAPYNFVYIKLGREGMEFTRKR